MMKTLVENYFTVEEKGCEIPGLNSTLLLKNSYVRVDFSPKFIFFKVKDIQYQVNFLMNYETNTFGMDVLYSITAKGEPYLKYPLHQENQVNESFIQTMVQREDETDKFLSEYYESHVEKRYRNRSKICGIKELKAESEDEGEGEARKHEEF